MLKKLNKKRVGFGLVLTLFLVIGVTYYWRYAMTFDAEFKVASFEHEDVYDGSFEYVSIVNTIANPERFHGKRVILTGVLDFQGTSYRMLYLDHDSYEKKILKNGASLDFSYELSDDQLRALKRLDGCFVEVYGIFNDYNGVDDFYSGKMADICYVRYAVW